MPTSRNRHKTPSTREQARRGFQSGMAGRVSNRELRRRAARAIQYGRQAYATLLAVLAQSGGEITVTAGTLDQVNQNYNAMGFVVEQKKDLPNEYLVRLTTGREETPEASAGDSAAGTEGAEETPHDVDGQLGSVQASDVPASV
jgi:hypothetical protein